MAASHDTPGTAPAEASAAAPAPDAPTPAAPDLEVIGAADVEVVPDLEPIVDWARTARRLRRQFVVIGGVVLVAWLVIGLTQDALTGRLLAELAGFGVLLAIAAEFVVVGGAALRGMLRAGERGERLSGADVSLLPPQVTCRRSRDC